MKNPEEHERANRDADETATGPVSSVGSSSISKEQPGDRIGRYKLLEKIGEGGMGAVWMAEQVEPVRRRVALKVIKQGMDSGRVLARFEAERQALALMDHPNIAKVLDAGSTPAGRPFFVMELVKGAPITRFCDQQQLSIRERLELFRPVCQAVQHAHQKGIIHRDLKPGNVLVALHDGRPVPMVIDFGVAKATAQRLTERTLFTEFGVIIGTPEYMSPEQAEFNQLDIDTRSDIYSLGVLLYELLTGTTPLMREHLRQSAFDELLRTIRQVDPPRPSTRLRQALDLLPAVSAQRKMTPAQLTSLLHGDLDWIVMKALEKDRARRYETANGLAMDIQRYLQDEPVVARPPGRLYRFQKSIRRNKLAYAATGAVAAALVLGIVATAWQAVRATQAKHEALAAQARAVAAQAGEETQRQKAEANEQEAIAAEKAEAAEELAARQRAYASEMNATKQSFEDDNLGRALDLLNRQQPQPGQKDLRGWEWRYLWQQTRSDALFTLCQHSSEIESLAVSADGRWLAVGVVHNDGLFVYDLQTRQQVAHLASGENSVRVAFSPTEPLLAFASDGNRATLRLWNAATRQMAGEFPLGRECADLGFSQDGKTIATATINGDVSLCRVSDGTKLASFPATDLYNIFTDIGFAVTPDLGLAAFSYGQMNSQRVRVIDLRNGKELWHTAAPKQYITTLAFSPDGKMLATAAGFNESDIHLWNVATGKEIGTLAGHGGFVSSIVFWPDGKKLASSSGDKTIRIWNVPGRKCLDVLRGHRQEVRRLALMPDDKTLVSGGKDGTVCVWDTSVTHPSQPRITVPERVVDWCFSPDGPSVLTLDRQGQVTRWPGPEFQQREPLLDVGADLTSGSDNSVFSRDGRFLAIGFTNGVTQVWDVSRRVLRRQWTNTTDLVVPYLFLANATELVVWCKSDNSNHEWDLASGRELQSWRAVSDVGNIVAFPDEKHYVEFGFNGAVQFKNAANDEVVETNLDFLEGSAAAVSPNGKLFAVASYLGYARVWNTSTWRETATLGGYLNGQPSVVFSPDGQRLATGGYISVRLWDVNSWQDVITLRGAGFLFERFAFSPDGNVIGALSREGILNLWRAPSWAEIHAAEAKDNMKPR